MYLFFLNIISRNNCLSQLAHFFLCVSVAVVIFGMVVLGIKTSRWLLIPEVDEHSSLPSIEYSNSISFFDKVSRHN